MHDLENIQVLLTKYTFQTAFSLTYLSSAVKVTELYWGPKMASSLVTLTRYILWHFGELWS